MIHQIIVIILQAGNGLDIGNAVNNAIGTGVIGGALGLATSAITNGMQLNQNQKLLDQQQKFNQDTSLFNEGVQLDMWNKTNYAAQEAQMEKAGLNPALMWSKGGMSGGTTAANTVATSQPQVQANASTAIEHMIHAANETQQTAANVPNTNADTENKMVQKLIGEQDVRIKTVAANVAEATQENAIAIIGQALKEAENNADIAATNNWINQNKAQILVDTAKEQLLGIGLQNILTKSQTALTDQQKTALIAQVQQGWKSLQIQDKNATTNWVNAITNRINSDTNTMNTETDRANLSYKKYIDDLPESTKASMNALMEVIGLSGYLAGKVQMPNAPRTPIGFNR